MTCTGPSCTNDAAYSGLCVAHHAQRRRHPKAELKPLRAGDSSAQVVFRLSKDLKSRAEKAAKRAGQTPGEWWREAGEEKLK